MKIKSILLIPALLLAVIFAIVSAEAKAISFSVFAQDGQINTNKNEVSWLMKAVNQQHYYNKNFRGIATLGLNALSNGLYSGDRLTFSFINDTDPTISVVDTFLFYGDLSNVLNLSPAENIFTADQFIDFYSFTGNSLDFTGSNLDFFKQTRDHNYQHAESVINTVDVIEPSSMILMGLGLLGFAGVSRKRASV